MKNNLSRLNALLRRVLTGFNPPENLTVSEWAEKHRRLSSETAAEPGRWRTARTPYLREPMDAFNDPKVRRIVMVAASQVGKSEFINNAIKGASPIADSFSKGTMERWKSQCPHCGEYHEIVWENIRYEYEETEVSHQRVYKVTKIAYMCPNCACASDELTMKRQPARWEADNPAAYENGVRSFWLNAFVSQWKSWESIVLSFLEAQGDNQKLQVVYNTTFGELWENRGNLEDEDGLLSRREEYPAELPDGVLVLTCGIDTQDDRLEYEVVGHGHFGETWGIEKGIIMGRPDADETWAALDANVLDRVYRYADGLGLKLSMSFMDEGGHFTQEVRQRCRERIGKKLFCIKGLAGQDRPYTGPPKQVRIAVNGNHRGNCWQYQIGVDAGKQIIMDNLRVKTPGPRCCHFPRRDDYGHGYFTGLLSERLTYNEKAKRHPWVWEKIPGHERNEALDCRNYANAAFKALPKDLDAIDRQLQQMRGKAPAHADSPAPKSSTAPARRSRARKSNWMEEW